MKIFNGKIKTSKFKKKKKTVKLDVVTCKIYAELLMQL